MSTYTITVRDYPHSVPLKEGAIAIAGCTPKFVEVKPIYKAFAPMASELKFDVSEMAIATYLQAHEAGKALSLLPVVMNGDFHHHSITQWPGREVLRPEDLPGKRVGVRAYSQTTGLWVRGALKEDFGVDAGQITWVTTEGPHVSEYVEPANVERTSSTLLELLEAGDIAAAVMGPVVLDDDGARLVPVIPDWQEAEEAWFRKHSTVPVNHMLTVRTDVLSSDPGAVRGIYDAFTAAIDASRPQGQLTSRQRAISYGLNDSLLAGLDIAIQYALEQDLIRTPVTADELFSDFKQHLGS